MHAWKGDFLQKWFSATLPTVAFLQMYSYTKVSLNSHMTEFAEHHSLPFPPERLRHHAVLICGIQALLKILRHMNFRKVQIFSFV